MGCGASLKVTAISQPTNKQESSGGDRPFKRTHFRFKLPAEVLQGFGELLKITARRTEKRKKPQIPEPSEVSMEHSNPTNRQSDFHDEATNHDDSKSMEAFAPHDSPDIPAIVEPPARPVPPPLPAGKLMVEERKELKETKEEQKEEEKTVLKKEKTETEVIRVDNSGSVEAEEFSMKKQKSIFYRVDDQRSEGEDGSAKNEEIEESDLLSPEAPRVLPDEGFEDEADSGPRKAARIELEKKAQEEAERIASQKRQLDEEVLEEQRGKMKGMEDAAQSILSKYQ